MLRARLTELIQDAVARLVAAGELPGAVSQEAVEIQDAKNPEHGDYACNLALMASKAAGLPPMEIAERLRLELLGDGGDGGAGGEGRPFAAIEVAGPGFLNIKLNPEYISRCVSWVFERGEDLPKTQRASHDAQRINVEFVSVNPNGPITVGSGRGAAFGDALSSVLAAAGHDVTREYYVNDGVNSEQMRLFAESVRSHTRGVPLPEGGYRGEYVVDVATAVAKRPNPVDDLDWFQQQAQDLMIERQREDLHAFGVDHDIWFSEQSLHEKGQVERAIEKLRANGAADDEPYRMEILRDDPDRGLVRTEQPPGAVWLRSSRFGDDQDRVLIREDGRPAYIAADVAYLESKLGERKFDKAYMILGPDHHGYIGRMYAMYEALGYEMGDPSPPAPSPRHSSGRGGSVPKRLEIVIFQIVRFVKDGKPAPMRKRDGNIYELRDLINELGAAVAPSADKEEQQRIGKDVARFFYLMRSHETHMDFDIDLATKQSDENPVFYAQYAHARICSVLRKAEEVLGVGCSVLGSKDPNTQHPTPNTAQLIHPKELSLIKKIVDLPWEVERCAADYGVHRLTTYAVDLARAYHLFYDACRVIQPEQPELSQARLALCQATKIALKATFDLLGISAPERMERESGAEIPPP